MDLSPDFDDRTLPPDELQAIAGIRTGRFRVGERCELTDKRGKRHSIILAADGVFHTTKGRVFHHQIIGHTEGMTVVSEGGGEFLVMRNLMCEQMVTMPRKAAIIYPKDAAQIVMWADIFPGARVLEAGVGSGALSMVILRSIGEHGRLTSYERRADFAEQAQANVTEFFGKRPPNWTVVDGDLVSNLRAEPVDRVVLDMLAPWECIDAVAERLVPGGLLCCYVATTTQMARVMDQIRVNGGFTEPDATENLVRHWHAEGLAVRPAHGPGSHTGFIVIARRMSPGHRPPKKRRRPAPGAYGVDYHGPRPDGVGTPDEEQARADERFRM